MVTKKEEKEAMQTAFNRIQKAFINMYGFAPSKKEIRPMEYGAGRFYGVYMIETLAFCIGRIGWVLTETGTVERAEQYDIEK